MKTILFILLLGFSLVQAEEQMLRQTPYKIVQDTLAKGKPIFVEAGSDTCHSCQIMGKTLYKVTQKYPTYNINFINVKDERQGALEFKIQMIPTQLIFDKKGKEVYRHVGILTASQIESLFIKYGFNKAPTFFSE